jgi:hypothetical protein
MSVFSWTQTDSAWIAFHRPRRNRSKRFASEWDYIGSTRRSEALCAAYQAGFTLFRIGSGRFALSLDGDVAIEIAAAQSLMTPSEYVRRSVTERLKIGGIDLASIAARMASS